MKAFPIALALALGVAVAPSARANPQGGAAATADVVRAKDLFDEGALAMQRGKFADAVVSLRASLGLARRAATAFNLAVALRGTGDSLGALELFDELAGGGYGELDAARSKEVEDLRAETRRELAVLTISVKGAAEAEVRVDGKEAAHVLSGDRIERRVNPGAHRVVVTARDHEALERTVELARGASSALDFELRAAVDRRPGHLVLECSEADAVLTIDGQGSARGKLERDLPAGDYDVRVKTSAGERKVKVAVPPGRRVRLLLDAPSKSVLERPLFWAITGTIVAGGVVAGVVAARSAKKDPVTSPVWGITPASFRWR